MSRPTIAQLGELEARCRDAQERAAFMVNHARDAQLLCAAAQEESRRLREALKELVKVCRQATATRIRSAGEVADHLLQYPAPVMEAAQAFAIADQAMFVALDSYGIDWDENGVAASVASDGGEPVSDLAHAIPALREAVEWLKTRQYIEVIVGDDKLLHVVVRERPEWAC